ncbi:hypothetical protein Dde_1850 [Oleidesulfovibrio alaskensis G20]|uniref:Uncharacterized protein n=1 Tax=Oleidesulfovibrio alaskensis (strain ATCC BAA-1058 / DSM 17464 / G20) TaxID=207559 RepID=Q310J9_OLEA2|nr:hypothetical protein [Oleidesulfovibrio alaskensis]ABB38647.2 hypothetical protein Dde_1850 [Oleidesulfovibrio alaskensis G20]MBG0774777.1 hypothetical protein [Oleidesulfovibrio alaskensis]
MTNNGTALEQSNLGRKYIKSFASGIAHMFAYSAEHYAWLAYRYQAPSVTIDIWSQRIEPGLFDIERNRILAGMCQQALQRNVTRLAPPAEVVSATVSARFGIENYLKDGNSASIGRSVFTAVLVDECGKQWQAGYVEERMLIEG